MIDKIIQTIEEDIKDSILRCEQSRKDKLLSNEAIDNQIIGLEEALIRIKVVKNDSISCDSV